MLKFTCLQGKRWHFYHWTIWKLSCQNYCYNKFHYFYTSESAIFLYYCQIWKRLLIQNTSEPVGSYPKVSCHCFYPIGSGANFFPLCHWAISRISLLFWFNHETRIKHDLYIIFGCWMYCSLLFCFSYKKSNSISTWFLENVSLYVDLQLWYYGTYCICSSAWQKPKLFIYLFRKNAHKFDEPAF